MTPKQPNIIFIVVDALRAQSLGCYGSRNQTSPTIDRLAAEGTLFENAFANVNATDASLTTLFTGKRPSEHGVYLQGKEKGEPGGLRNPDLVFLSEILRERLGYYTIALDWLGRWHERGYDEYSGILVDQLGGRSKFLRKFKQKVQKAQTVLQEKNINKDDATLLTEVALQSIREHKDHRNKPFFLFIHYWDVHTPYSSPEKFIRPTAQKDLRLEEVLNRVEHPGWRKYLQRCFENKSWASEVVEEYRGAIRYVDAEIKRITDMLTASGLSEETIVIVTADHGESLTEHGIYFDHHGLYDETTHVPLIFWGGDDWVSRQRLQPFVQLIDIFPSMLSMLGENPVNYATAGMDFWALVQGKEEVGRELVFLEEFHTANKKAIRNSEYKYIFAESKEAALCSHCGRMHGDPEELYNLTNDPNEKVNLIAKHPEIAKQLKEVAAQDLISAQNLSGRPDRQPGSK